MPNNVGAMLVPSLWHDRDKCCLAIPVHNECKYTVHATQTQLHVEWMYTRMC